ncbi:DUF1572 domain-containing protein [Flavobacterium sp. NRK1]|uniref:DUF1572 domain-containing protein n=1 Tax=Flavobacterium sp. NRK1 TaxID=2954929 RepID=UPI0020934AC4|nr:DUF1572 domain-containing protein [Flavobacterium sp. NRK1]MCO6148846.1 DUF1572 domain-containing protein [Flavobacterium sp. NRK1]
MNMSEQIAKHFKEVFFGGNWTTVNLKDTLADVTWQEAIAKKYSFNTIATLTYHITYYVSAITKVLEGGPLDASDKLSFNHPPIESQKDWDDFLTQKWQEAHRMADLIEQLPENMLAENFSDEKYGSYYRNFHGLIEHTHYHLGQIVLIKKII